MNEQGEEEEEEEERERERERERKRGRPIANVVCCIWYLINFNTLFTEVKENKI